MHLSFSSFDFSVHVLSSVEKNQLPGADYCLTLYGYFFSNNFNLFFLTHYISIFYCYPLLFSLVLFRSKIA